MGELVHKKMCWGCGCSEWIGGLVFPYIPFQHGRVVSKHNLISTSKHRNVGGVGIPVYVYRPRWRGSGHTTSTAVSIGTSVGRWANYSRSNSWHEYHVMVVSKVYVPKMRQK